MDKLYYCEFCGRMVANKPQICPHCHSEIIPKESLQCYEYYRKKSIQIYGNGWNSNQVLVDEEVSQNPNFDFEKYQEAFTEMSQTEIKNIVANVKQKSNIPKCPTCGSTNIKRISSVSKAAHGLAFGLFSKTARSQFECLNCHYKW